MFITVAGQSWAKSYGGSSLDKGSDIIQTNDEGFIITGYTNSFAEGAIEQHAYIIKVDEQGNEKWSYLSAWENNPYNWANAVELTSDGGYLIACRTSTVNIKSSIYLTKLTEDGNEEWSKLLLDSLDAFSQRHVPYNR